VATISETLVEAVHHHRSGRWDHAEAIYRQVLQTDPNQADALHLLGVLSHQSGRHTEAVGYIGRAIELNPVGVSYYVNLGLARHALGQLKEALAAYRRALELDPQKAETHNNLGNVFRDLGRADTAIGCYRGAIELKPEYAEAHYNLGNVLKDQGRLVEAVARYRRAVEIKTDYARALQALGSTLSELGEVDQAEAGFRQLQGILPDKIHSELQMAALGPSVFEDNQQIDQYRARLLTRLRNLFGQAGRLDFEGLSLFGAQPPFGLLYHGRPDRPIKKAYADVFRHSFDKPAPSPRQGLPRIGFVVTNTHEGVFLRCMRGLFEHVRAGLFEMAVVASPGGTLKLRAGIKNEAVQILTIPDRFDLAAEAIRQFGFDLLYFWEIGTDAQNYFLPFCRLAPVQCTSWGVPATSGIPQVDYYLSSDLVEDAQADDHYTERLYRAKTLLAYEYRMELPETPKTRTDFGFGDQQHLYLCPQQLRKLHPDFDPILGGILRNDAAGVVVLVSDAGGHVAAGLQARFQKTISDVAGRIAFLPWQTMPGYASLLAASDVILDTLYYGGALTSYDAFSFHQPVVTLPTAFRRGRYTLACYRRMGLDDCLAQDAQDYVRIAVRLGSDRDYRQTIRDKIRAADHLLFEDLDAIRELEQFLLDAIHRQRSQNR
jgi:predicted O-linked N-acetylglucosamine transferase (SPINDLY family)